VLKVRRRPDTTTTDVLIADESGTVHASLTGMSFEELQSPAGSDLSRMLHHVTWHSVPWDQGERPSAVELDRRLHAERVTDGGKQRTHREELDELPDAVFVRLPGDDATPLLVHGDGLLAWSAGGYTHRVARPHGVAVEVLTPPLVVEAIRGGYSPALHTSAG
jgi:hypothetical protein